jgi:hypothetical protein
MQGTSWREATVSSGLRQHVSSRLRNPRAFRPTAAAILEPLTFQRLATLLLLSGFRRVWLCMKG